MKNMNDRIRERRKELKLTQHALAEMAGVNRVTLTGWEAGSYQPNGANLYALSRALKCSQEWLMTGASEEAEEPAPQKLTSLKVKQVPLISWVQAGAWTTTEPGLCRDDATEWVHTTASVSEGAFALTVKGDSMTNPSGSPSIPEGSIIIVDPDIPSIESINGKIVVAYIDGGTEATLKKFVDDWPNRYLVPLNPNYKAMECGNGCHIVGKVKQVIMNF
ncbi:LexA family protein [Enterobacter ludwigii]|uniref:LexA family protein n=1 Tax=Enterobacter TaxID=547 RepID=UPI003BEEC1D5